MKYVHHSVSEVRIVCSWRAW